MSILRNSVNMFLARGLVVVLTVATYALASRALGASVFGIYSLVIVFHTLLICVVNLGFGYSNSCFAAKGRIAIGELHVNSIISSMGIGLLLAPIYYLGAGLVGRFLLKGVDFPLPWVAVAAVPLALYYLNIQGIWIGRGKISLINLVEVFRAGVWFSGSVATYLLFGGNVLAMLSAWLFAWLASAALSFYLICLKEPSPFRLNLASLKELASFGFMINLGALATISHSRLGIFLVNYFLGTAAAGFYNLAVTLSESLTLIPITVMSAAASKVFGTDPEESWRVVVDVARPILILLLGAAALALIASPVLIPLIYGSQYVPAAIPLMILLPGMVAICFALIPNRYISGNLALPETTTRLAWLAVGLNMLLSLILIPSFGINGAALALAISYTASLGFVLIVLSRRHKKRVFELLHLWEMRASLRRISEI